MPLTEKIMNLGGTDYLVRFPVLALMRVEAELGRPISTLSANAGLIELTTVVKHGMHHAQPPHTPLSAAEFEALIDSVGLEEFSAIIPDIVELINPGATAAPAEQAPGKN